MWRAIRLSFESNIVTIYDVARGSEWLDRHVQSSFTQSSYSFVHQTHLAIYLKSESLFYHYTESKRMRYNEVIKSYSQYARLWQDNFKKRNTSACLTVFDQQRVRGHMKPETRP